MREKRHTHSCVFDKGLEVGSNPFETNPARALDALNYLYRDGKVQKRFGFTELLNVRPTNYVKVNFDGSVAEGFRRNGVAWNGIWEFKAEDGERHVVAHIGKLLYEVVGMDGDSPEAKPITYSSDTVLSGTVRYVYCYEFLDYRSQIALGANRLYFLGGNQFMRLRFFKSGGNTVTEFVPVANASGTYIPTTTISITAEYAVASGRASLDDVNLLHDFRYNTLLTGVKRDSGKVKVSKDYRYVLDAPIVCRDVNRDMAAFSMTLRERMG